MKEDTKTEELSPRMAGAAAAQRLGSTRDHNPHPPGTTEAEDWAQGWEDATERLVKLFEAWLALGHSTPLLALGKSGQALGPMVSGLIATNGNASGAILVGALAAHDGRSLRDILPTDVADGRNLFEATQFAILGLELPEALRWDERAESFYCEALMIDAFRMHESEIAPTEEGQKMARVSFDLAEFLRTLVQGRPDVPETEEEGGES